MWIEHTESLAELPRTYPKLTWLFLAASIAKQGFGSYCCFVEKKGRTEEMMKS
jgi:hypothetical protein